MTMGWFDDDSRDYDRAAGYSRDRSFRGRSAYRGDARDGRGMTGGHDRSEARYQRGGYWGESEARPGYGRDYLGRQFGYDSDYDYAYRRRSPHESPFYGRDADRGVQRWARRYGYDMQYEIQPRDGGYGAQRGYADRGYGDPGRGRFRDRRY
jgi:hypothetical protein